MLHGFAISTTEESPLTGGRFEPTRSLDRAILDGTNRPGVYHALPAAGRAQVEALWA
jgi:hypothetical protein